MPRAILECPIDNKRLGKQRVETFQILNVNLKKIADPNIKIAYENHPAILMWRGFEKALAFYGLVICEEWIERGFADSLYPRFSYFLFPENHILPNKDYPMDFPMAVYGIETFYEKHQEFIQSLNYPDWLGNERLHSSHRAALLEKNPDFYAQFNWAETPRINYYWPVRKGDK